MSAEAPVADRIRLDGGQQLRGVFWLTPAGAGHRNVFVLRADSPDGPPTLSEGHTYGPYSAQSFLDAVRALSLTEGAEQHTRDCCDCVFELQVRDVMNEPGASPLLCPVGVKLVAEARAARRAALAALGVLP
jgi:hypothetical protein